MCEHELRCPAADAPDWHAARVVSEHQEQGWSLLFTGVVFFDDMSALLPDGRVVSLTPHLTDPSRAA